MSNFLTNGREFLWRTTLYKKPIWQCEHTGRNNLTLKEAISSENDNKSKIERNIANFHLRKATLSLVQFRTYSVRLTRETMRVESLVDFVHSYLQYRYFKGEEVSYRDETTKLRYLFTLMEERGFSMYCPLIFLKELIILSVRLTAMRTMSNTL